MFGTILGDIIGSPFEFDRGDKTKVFKLFTEGCGFTDDTVMTVAVGEALLKAGEDADAGMIKAEVSLKMQEWGRRYPNAGYGERFRDWLYEEEPKPYGSYGNGSAMRVSAAGWLYSSLEQTREVAAATAGVTHNHSEGIKGAAAVASCIYLARNGLGKAEIKDYVKREFSYDLDRTLAQIRPSYCHVECCQETVPEAIIVFLEANDFEDAVRNAVSPGGDTDTLAAITGSIAEAFFGISEGLKEECRDRIDDNLEKILKIFDDRISKQKDFLFRISKYEGGYRLERNQNTITICEQQGRLGLKILLKRLEYRLGIRLSFEEVKTIIDRDSFYVQTV